MVSKIAVNNSNVGGNWGQHSHFQKELKEARVRRDEARKQLSAGVDPSEMLRAMDDYQGTLMVRCALRIAPLVFVRPGELRKAEWAAIDLDNAEWRFTVTKTDTLHIVPLARQTVERPDIPLHNNLSDNDIRDYRSGNYYQDTP